MSTGYYFKDRESNHFIGQIHSLGKDKGYHFTWKMLPLEFHLHTWEFPLIIDGHGDELTMRDFIEMVARAKSQSVDERIE